jgi:iron complex outermembrane receptor protein
MTKNRNIPLGFSSKELNVKVYLSFRRSLFGTGLILYLAVQMSLAATLSGVVTDEKNAPAADVQVVVPAVQKGTRTDSTGAYKIEALTPGSYAVEFRRVGNAPVTRQADLSKGDATVNVALGGTPLMLAPITITAAPEAKSALETPASVSVVEGRQLEQQPSQSVISSIQSQPGISMIDEGATVVKPVIRGLNSQDIVVVEDGVRQESEQWGNEHAPEIDPLGTDRIEVLRGPNSLMYGSDALGGVIAINHPELPNAHLGAGPLSGLFTGMVNSNNNSVGENFEAAGAVGDWGYRANVSQMQAGNFRNPQDGYVPNTGLQQVAGNGAFGLRQDWGSLDADFGKFNKRVELQNPSAPFPAPFDDLEYQTLQHDHGKIHSTVLSDWANWDVTLGYDRSDRKEFDGPSVPGNMTLAPDAPHLNWIETSYTLDAKAHLAPLGALQGTVGLSGLRRLDQSLGLVDLTPTNDQSGVGEYLMEDLPVGKFDFTAGVRGDQDEYNVSADNKIGIDPDNNLNSPHPVAAQTLHYSAVSAAAGGVYHITEPLAFAVNLGRGYRNPVPFELFAYGVHEGAAEFLIGNPNLSPETSFDTDASLRWSSPRIKGEVGVFRNYIHNYIFGVQTGQFFNTATGQFGSSGDLPVSQETQGNATIKGLDGAINVAATNWLTLNTVYNMVRGFNDLGSPDDNTNYLPHVPADNVLFGANLHRKSLGALSNPYFEVDEKLIAAQDRTNGPPVASGIPTPGYGLTDLHAGGEFVVMNNRITLDVGVNNLFNKGYIDYNSILKEFNIQDPGRNVYAKVTVPFGS